MTSKRTIILSLCIFIICVFYYTYYYNYGISLTDEGYFINTTVRIMNGQLPYLDFRYYPPALNYLLAFIFEIFKIDLLYERLLWVFILSICVLMILKLSKIIMEFPFWIFPAILLLLIPGPWHKSIIPLLYLSAALMGFGYIKNKTNQIKWSFYCGVQTSISLYFRYDISGFLIVTFFCLITVNNLLLFPLRNRAFKNWLKEIIFYIIGLAIFMVPALIYAIYAQIQIEFLSDLVRRVSQEHKTMGFPFPKLDLSAITSNPSGFYFSALFYVPPIVLFSILFVLILRYYRNKTLKNEDMLVFLLWLLGLFSYNQTMVRTDYGHLLQSVQIPYILSSYLFWLCFRAVGRAVTWPKYLAKVSIVTILLFVCGTYIYLNVARGEFYGGTIGNIKNKTTRLLLPNARVFLEPSDAREIEDVVAFVNEKTAPDDPILVLPYEPMYYVLTGRCNPTQYDGIFPSTLSGTGMEKAYLRKIKNAHIKLIIYNDMKFTNEDKSRFSVYDKKIYNFIKLNYRLVKIIGNDQIYLK